MSKNRPKTKSKTNKHKSPKKNANDRLDIKLIAFRVIAFSLPILFFILMEIGLRLFNYGTELPLFINTPDSNNYILARPDIIKRYFPNTENIPSVTLEANLFLKNKPKNAIRIFVQGGSTAAGFPYGFGASPAGMLDQRISRTFPNRTVEVINTAMSAVNSYTLLDFVDEIIEQEPDAVLIYAGHNEYLGILGVGSNYTTANSHAANLLFLKLKDYRVFQLVQNLYSSLTSTSGMSSSTKQGDLLKSKRTMMAKAAKNRNIEFNSDVYKKGLEQFESNLELILSKYHSAGIPVLISTVASNLKDHPPFSSVNIEQNERQVLTSLSNAIKKNKGNVKYKKTFNDLLAKAKQHKNADLYYELAKIQEQLGNYDQAKNLYILAKENDLLRFRAPEHINNVIRQTAKSKGAILVDYQNNLARSSPNHIIGNNFMLEHLHPNLQGYFILADSFYQKLKLNKLFGDWESAIPTSQAWKERPIIAAEEYAGFAKIVQLKSDYPYTNKPKRVVLPKPADWQQEIGLRYFSKQINWLDMLNLSYKGYLDRRNIPMILKTSEMIADAIPHNAEANFRVAKQQLQEGNASKALKFLDKALAEEPNNKNYNSLKLKLPND